MVDIDGQEVRVLVRSEGFIEAHKLFKMHVVGIFREE
jgi:hypothetical protein